MKWIIRILFFTVVAGLAYGFYLRQSNYSQGEKLIGLSVLILCLLLMPLFIFHRYRHKDLSRLTFRDASDNENQDKESS